MIQKGLFFWTESHSAHPPLSDDAYERKKEILRASVRKKQRFAPYSPPLLSQSRLSSFLTPYPNCPPSLTDIHKAQEHLGSDFAQVLCRQMQENVDELAQFFQLPSRFPNRKSRSSDSPHQTFLRQQGKEDLPQTLTPETRSQNDQTPPYSSISDTSMVSVIDQAPSPIIEPFPSSSQLLSEVETVLQTHFHQTALQNLLQLSSVQLLQWMQSLLHSLHYHTFQVLTESQCVPFDPTSSLPDSLSSDSLVYLYAQHPDFEKSLILIHLGTDSIPSSKTLLKTLPNPQQKSSFNSICKSDDEASFFDSLLIHFHVQHALVISFGEFPFSLPHKNNSIQCLDLHLLLELMIKHQVGITHHQVSYYSLNSAYFEQLGQREK